MIPETDLYTFALLVFTSFFTIINPLGTMPIFMTMTASLSKQRRKQTAKKATLVAFFTILAFAFSGQILFNFFGISVNSFRIVGGVIFFTMGWDMLQARLGSFKHTDDEDKIDAVTALSGSGPAYVFMFIEALIVAGQKIGLSLEEAQILSYSTIYGSALLAENNTTSLDDLIKNVTSKGGTTEQGIKVLNDHNFKKIIQLATEAAYNRAKEIGNN